MSHVEEQSDKEFSISFLGPVIVSTAHKWKDYFESIQRSQIYRQYPSLNGLSLDFSVCCQSAFCRNCTLGFELESLPGPVICGTMHISMWTSDTEPAPNQLWDQEGNQPALYSELCCSAGMFSRLGELKALSSTYNEFLRYNFCKLRTPVLEVTSL